MQFEIEGFQCEAQPGTDYQLAAGSVVILINGMIIGSGINLRDAVADARGALKATNAQNEIRARLGVPLVEVTR